MTDNIFTEAYHKASFFKKSKKALYLAYFIIACFSLYILFKIEKYIFYIPTYYLILLITRILQLQLTSTFLSITSILIIIYLHLSVFRMLILSIVFLLGGFAKKIVIYFYFKDLIENVLKSITSTIIQLQNTNFHMACEKIYALEEFHKIYNNQKLTGNTFEIKEAQFGDVINDIMYAYNQLKEQSSLNNEINITQYQSLIDKLNNLKDILKKYEQFSYLQMLYKFKSNAFLKHLSQQYIDDVLLKYNRQVNHITIKDSLTGLLILPNNKEANNKNNNSIKTLVIFCNQNAVCSEIYTLGDGNISPYLDIPSTTILLWNYAGYGTRPGFPSFSSIDKDVKSLAQYINTEYSSYKIIVHGTSIGGYAAIKLVQALNNNSNVMLIADRTFGDIDLIVRTMRYGRILVKIYNFVFPKLIYKSNNVSTYVKINSNNKMIIYDEEDTIILYKASLIKEISNKFWKDVIYTQIVEVIHSKHEQWCKGSLAKLIQHQKNPLNPKFKFRRIDINRLLISKEDKEKLNNELNLLYNSLDDDESKQLKEFLKRICNGTNIESFIRNLFVYGLELAAYKEISPIKQNRNNAYTYIPFIIQKLALNPQTGSIAYAFLMKLNYIFVNVMLDVISNKNKDENVLDNIEKFNFNNNEVSFKLKDDIDKKLLNYFGCVRRIFCGHNGNLHRKDIEYLYNVLKDKGFIDDEYIKDNHEYMYIYKQN